MRQTCIIILALLLAVLPLRGQSASTGQQDLRPPLPATINGDMFPVEAIPEMQRTREWRASLGFAAACDDNALGSPTEPASDCASIVQPSFALTQVGSRSNWNLTYEARFAKHFRFSEMDELAQSAGLDVQHRFTRRLSVRLREAFVTTNGFGWSSGASDVPTFGLLQGGNAFAITPAVSHLRSTTGAETTYQLSAKSFLGVSGSYSALRYSDSDTTTLSLIENDTVTGGAFYERNVGRHSWLGINYDWQRIQSGGLPSTVSHSFLYTHTLVLTPRLSISGFVGPQYSRSESGSTQAPLSTWSVAAGGNVGWKNDNAQLTVSASHLVSDGGGLLGAVQLKQISASTTRNFGRSWTTRIAGYYAVSDTLREASMIRTFSVSAELERRLYDNFLVGLGYGRDWQDATSTATSAGLIERNRISLSFRYTLGGRLGR